MKEDYPNPTIKMDCSQQMELIKHDRHQFRQMYIDQVPDKLFSSG